MVVRSYEDYNLSQKLDEILLPVQLGGYSETDLIHTTPSTPLDLDIERCKYMKHQHETDPSKFVSSP